MVPDCRDLDKDSKKYLFAILGFFYEFLLILQIHCKNLKTNLILCLSPWICRKPPGKIWGSRFGPWLENRGGARLGRPAPAAPVAGGEGPRVDELEEGASYLGVCSD